MPRPLRRFASLLVPAAVFLSLAAQPSARADSAAGGFALDRFEPSERGSSWFALDSLDLRGVLRPAAGLVLDFAYKPLVIFDEGGSQVATLVDRQIFAHAGASLVLADRMRFGFSVPVSLNQGGQSGSADGVAYQAPNAAALGDLRIAGDLRLFGEHLNGATGTIGVAVWIPSGSRSQYTGDGSVRVSPRVQLAGTAGVFTWATRVGWQYRGLDSSPGVALGSELQAGLAMGFAIDDGRMFIGPELTGSTVANGHAFERRASPFELLLGAHHVVADDWRLGVGVGPGLSQGTGTPQFRVVASLEWAPGYHPPDRDGDGIIDAEDACPDRPGVRTNNPRTNGCPRPKPAPPPPPPPPPPPDRDHDGIIDAEDACPDEPGVASPDPTKNGCPPPKDRDGDGIIDAEDACPDEPGVKSPDPAKNGCPPPPDRDGDGILDADDACPDVPGIRSEDPKKNGCPAAVIDEKTQQIVILEQVKFKTGSAEILPESEPILNGVREILEKHPEIKEVRVEGHTDSRGGKAYNLNLSKERAASVVRWLLQHGIDSDRLDSEGFGLAKPLDTNRTEAGRRNNRRVEFHILHGPDKAK